jgi:hypothetical protein
MRMDCGKGVNELDDGGSRVLMARRVDLDHGREDVERKIVSVDRSDWPVRLTRSR